MGPASTIPVVAFEEPWGSRLAETYGKIRGVHGLLRADDIRRLRDISGDGVAPFPLVPSEIEENARHVGRAFRRRVSDDDWGQPDNFWLAEEVVEGLHVDFYCVKSVLVPSGSLTLDHVRSLAEVIRDNEPNVRVRWEALLELLGTVDWVGVQTGWEDGFAFALMFSGRVDGGVVESWDLRPGQRENKELVRLTNAGIVADRSA